jgi:hypothetical protein
MIRRGEKRKARKSTGNLSKQDNFTNTVVQPTVRSESLPAVEKNGKPQLKKK